MYQHAQMQKAVSEAFTFLPTYLGLLAENHWLVQFQNMNADVEDEDFLPEDGATLARGETEDEWLFAWKMANGRLMVARALYPEFSDYDGIDLLAEVLPEGTDEQVALEWVRSRSAEGSFATADEEDDAEDAGMNEFTTAPRRVERPAPVRGNGRQPTLWERMFGRR
jgi:hypothetical protein